MEQLILLLAVLAIFRYENETIASADCAGVAGGTAEIDHCGVCDTDKTNDCVPDCAGVLGGTAIIDCMVGCTNTQLYVELWGECYSIENTMELYRHSNGLAGEIPPEIGQLANLTTLSLSYNQFTGDIPAEIWTLTNLTTLSLSYNQFKGEIPVDIRQLTNLTYLYLDYNEFTGEIPPEICIQGVFSPYLTDNKLCPPYPSCIADYVGEQNTSECEYCEENPDAPDCN
tara:strand:+ start:167 stop:850 length:684 start_codon:yes stop_codon:yes gene_type:complete